MPKPRIPTLADVKLVAAHPATALRLLKGAVRVLAGEKRPLHGVEFAVTYRCELDCAHCLTKPLIDPARAEMTAKEVIRAVEDLADLGAIFVNLTGGEALLRPDIFDILDAATRRRGLLVTLASNGLLIDDPMAIELRRVRAAIVTMSLDGPDAPSHDASRGRAGAFDRLMAAIESLRRVRIPVWLTAILTRENAGDGAILRTAELARRLGAALTINWAYAVGRNWGGREALVGEVETRTFRTLMKMRHVRWEGSTNFRAEGCPAGSEKIYVTPYGEVFPCAVIQSSFGNMLEEPIREIWRRMGAVPEFCGQARDCLAACDGAFIRTHFDRIRRRPGAPHDWNG